MPRGAGEGGGPARSPGRRGRGQHGPAGERAAARTAPWGRARMGPRQGCSRGCSRRGAERVRRAGASGAGRTASEQGLESGARPTRAGEARGGSVSARMVACAVSGGGRRKGGQRRVRGRLRSKVEAAAECELGSGTTTCNKEGEKRRGRPWPHRRCRDEGRRGSMEPLGRRTGTTAT
nr:serine/arginine repetitive matrix protein 2-like [Aegilops tauschii subsp. strangulata]